MSKYKEYITKQLYDFDEDIKYYEEHVIDKESFYQSIRNTIIQLTNKYTIETNIETKQEIADRLKRYYSLLNYIKITMNSKSAFYDEELGNLPTVYDVQSNPILFDINQDILDSIDLSEGLTEEQAHELLKWDVNSTRLNINKSSKHSGYTDDVYKGYHLQGFCGFSQYLFLHPLEKMGLNITINNISCVNEIGRHAFGTVTLPIKQGDEIINKQYLIDCTYCQFFQAKDNTISRYYNSKKGTINAPSVGFFINTDDKYISFAKQLLRDGYIELTEDNIRYYFEPFIGAVTPLSEVKDIEDKFDKLDIPKILKDDQEEFNYDEDEVLGYGCSFELPLKQNVKER